MTKRQGKSSKLKDRKTKQKTWLIILVLNEYMYYKKKVNVTSAWHQVGQSEVRAKRVTIMKF